MVTRGTMYYRGYDVLPVVRMIPEGELFAGTWVLSGCTFARRIAGGHELRSLIGDNEHFATRREVLQAALVRAMRTIDLGEVGSLHLSPLPSPKLYAR